MDTSEFCFVTGVYSDAWRKHRLKLRHIVHFWLETEQCMRLGLCHAYSTGSFENDHFNVWSPSTVFKVPVGEKWNVHAEYFGVLTEGRAKEGSQHFFGPGALPR